MKKTYEIYFRAGNEPLKFKYCMFSENEHEIIQALAKQMQMLLYKNLGVECEYIAFYGTHRVCNFIF